MAKILASGPVIELRNTRGNHNKFYRAWIEEIDEGGEQKFFVVTHWGRIGTAGQRGAPKVKRNLVLAMSELQAVLIGKLGKGYDFFQGPSAVLISGRYLRINASNYTLTRVDATPQSNPAATTAPKGKARKRLTKAQKEALASQVAATLAGSDSNDFSVL